MRTPRSFPPWGLPFILLGLPFAANCGSAEGRMLAQPVVDTLPGDIPRTMSPSATAWVGETGWQVELVEEISGEEETPSELVNPQSIALDDWRRLYVVDQKPMVIKVYGADGQFIRTIGGEGEGPGEFRVGFVAVRGAHVVLHDPRVARTSVWDTAGTFLRSWVSSCCHWGDIHVDRQGRVYIPSMVTRTIDDRRGQVFVRWTMQGAVVDTVWLPGLTSEGKHWTVTTTEGGRTMGHMSMMVPLAPRVVNGFNPDGGFLVGQSDSYQIVVAPRGGDSSTVFGRVWSGVPVTVERKRRLVEATIQMVGTSYGEDNLRRIFKLEDIPDQAPAFIALHVDGEGNRWVRMDPGLDSTRAVFDVFTAEGVYLGATSIAPAPPEYGRLIFGQDEVVVARENEAGLPVVARYRVVR